MDLISNERKRLWRSGAKAPRKLITSKTLRHHLQHPLSFCSPSSSASIVDHNKLLWRFVGQQKGLSRNRMLEKSSWQELAQHKCEKGNCTSMNFSFFFPSLLLIASRCPFPLHEQMSFMKYTLRKTPFYLNNTHTCTAYCRFVIE